MCANIREWCSDGPQIGQSRVSRLATAGGYGQMTPRILDLSLLSTLTCNHLWKKMVKSHPLVMNSSLEGECICRTLQSAPSWDRPSSTPPHTPLTSPSIDAQRQTTYFREVLVELGPKLPSLRRRTKWCPHFQGTV